MSTVRALVTLRRQKKVFHTAVIDLESLAKTLWDSCEKHPVEGDKFQRLPLDHHAWTDGLVVPIEKMRG